VLAGILGCCIRPCLGGGFTAVLPQWKVFKRIRPACDHSVLCRPFKTKGNLWCREGESNPQGTKYRRILSSTAGSAPFRKFSTLLDSSTAYKNTDSPRYDPFCRVLNMELLQFYYSQCHRSSRAPVPCCSVVGALARKGSCRVDRDPDTIARGVF
jgi:hypothetical protein